MKKHSFFTLSRVSLLGAVLTLIAQPALAVTFFETFAISDTVSGTLSDTQGPSTTGSIQSEVIVPPSDGAASDFSGDGYARSAADDTGAGAVDVDAIFYSGDPALNTISATSVLTSEITNNTGDIATFVYDYFLPGPELTIADFAGMSDLDDPTVRAFFDFRVSLDFGTGYLPFVVSQGELKGGYVSHTLGTAGTDTLSSTFFTDGLYPNNIFGYQFADLDDSITGLLGDGDTLSVQTSLFVSLTAPGFETGGSATIGDPLDLSSGAFSDSLRIVPVPAAVWLFATGLIGLIGFARRS